MRLSERTISWRSAWLRVSRSRGLGSCLRSRRRRGDLHLNTVNSRHERFKTFLRGRRGVDTKYLGSYLAWYHLAILPKLPTPRCVLASVAGITPVGQLMCLVNAN